MMMALRRKKKRFNVGPEALEQIFKRFHLLRLGDAILFGQDPLRVREVANFSPPLKNEIETMDRRSGRSEKFGDRVEA
jgi:hypothetical protein